MLELYQRVVLSRNFPEHHLQKGDILTLVDYVPHPSGDEDGYILEVFNAVGESINVIAVPISAVKPLKNNEIITVRSRF
ncbi:MAG: DUF4926 domain-containing protein [Coleofasciculus chthonoplastes F3-SA18-01]|uniref:DUF4926 domain-containing protein n=1 Tax=Coleofasciculus chthonoplastes TaxID=64178 RepID=UPI0032F3ABF5